MDQEAQSSEMPSCQLPNVPIANENNKVEPVKKIRKSAPKKRRTVDQKIEDVQSLRDVLAKIQKLEEEELDPNNDDCTVLESIDKLHKKALECEKILCKFVDYEDAEYNTEDPGATKLYSTIFITNSGLEPLNQKLTDYVNVIRNDDAIAGFRCLTLDILEEMIESITKAGDCPIASMIIPSDDVKREEFFISIMDKTNAYCRAVRHSEFIQEKEAELGDCPDDINDDKLEKNVKQSVEKVKICESVPSSASLNSVLVNMKAEGIFETQSDPIDFIDLEKEDTDAEDEEGIEVVVEDDNDKENMCKDVDKNPEELEPEDLDLLEQTCMETDSSPSPSMPSDDAAQEMPIAQFTEKAAISDLSKIEESTKTRFFEKQESENSSEVSPKSVEEIPPPITAEIEMIEIIDSETEGNDDDDDIIIIN